MRVVRLEPGPIRPEIRAEFLLGPVYLSDPEPHAIASLLEAGVPWAPLGEEIDSAGVLVLPLRPLDELSAITDRLLGPGGCPWDRAQTHESLKKYLLEEAYEVIEAIDSGQSDMLKEELGDLLLQPVLHAQIRKAAGDFDIDDVARGISAKLIRRHPHVFGDLTAEDADEVLRNWDRIKKQEKGDAERSILAGVPNGMAALLKAHEVSKRAARAGFEWPNIEAVYEKMREEEAELAEAIRLGDSAQVEAELGDLLFTIVNIARWLKVDPEEALRKMVNRFIARFQYVERAAHQNLADLSPEVWDELWEQAKAATA